MSIFGCCPNVHVYVLVALSLRYSFANGPSKTGADSSWLSGLDRVESDPALIATPSPRHAAQPSPTVTSPPAASSERDDLRVLIRDQKRAIEVLEAEKASLNAAADRLSHVENSTLFYIHFVRPLSCV